MHYYSHHIGDYRRDTSALSLAEHGAYRLLMDEYYVTQRRLPADAVALCRICAAMTPAERAAVKSVSARFFTVEDGMLTHKRIDAEIEAYDKQAETNRANGRKGGRKPSPQPAKNPLGSVSDVISDSEPEPAKNPNQEPITIDKLSPARADDWPTLERVRQSAESVLAPPECAEAFWNEMEGCGWVNKHGQTVADWRALLRNYATRWKANAFRDKQKQPKNTPTPAPYVPRAF